MLHDSVKNVFALLKNRAFYLDVPDWSFPAVTWTTLFAAISFKITDR